MIIGFTGSRNGMSDAQRVSVRKLLSHPDVLTTVDVGLHGDCIGADADFDALCKEVGMQTKIRPCTYDNMRANTESEQIAEPMHPMARNRCIVEDASVMISCPPNDTIIKSGSGTWATIGFARKAKKQLYIVYPDGRVDEENKI